MDTNSDVSEPGGNLAAERCASGHKDTRATSHGVAHLGKHQFISQLPRQGSRSFAAKDRFAVGASHRHGPVEELTFYALRLVLNRVVDLLVQSGHGHEYRGMHLAKRA